MAISLGAGHGAIDDSGEPLTSKSWRHKRPKVHLIGFYSLGAPWDAGPDLSSQARRFLRLTKKHFSTVTIFSTKDLILEDPTWRETLRDFSQDIRNDPDFSEEVVWNEVWSRVGLMRWKPRLILDFLLSERVSDGDIVMYHDIDVEKYPVYVEGISHWARWVRRKIEAVDVLVFEDSGTLLSEDTKPELIEFYFGDSANPKWTHVWAGALAVKKTSFGLEFVRFWNEECTVANLWPISSSACQGFLKHSHEQAVLGCLYYLERAQSGSTSISREALLGSRRIPPKILARRLRKIFRTLQRSIGGKRLISQYFGIRPH